MNVTVSGVVRAAPRAVFAYLAELEHWPRWQDDMKLTEPIAGDPGWVGARYRYVSKAMGQTFDSTVRLVRVDPPGPGTQGEIAFEGDWAEMLRPVGRYLVESAPEGSRVTLNPQPETRSIGRLFEPLMGPMARRLNEQYLTALRRVLES